MIEGCTPKVVDNLETTCLGILYSELNLNYLGVYFKQ